MPSFRCEQCGDDFTLSRSVLDRYPGWTPRLCRSCRAGAAEGKQATTPSGDIPGDGVYTDGGASPNPGPGGWGAVYVVDGEIVAEAHGHDPATTNNRMELTALIEGAAMVPKGTGATVWSDSNLAVRTITEWAAGWERNGWRRKSGPVENLDLVRAAYAVYRRRPELALRWVKGHAGHRWNEYADALANRWRT
jgi:ribonuclease HI